MKHALVTIFLTVGMMVTGTFSGEVIGKSWRHRTGTRPVATGSMEKQTFLMGNIHSGDGIGDDRYFQGHGRAGFDSADAIVCHSRHGGSETTSVEVNPCVRLLYRKSHVGADGSIILEEIFKPGKAPTAVDMPADGQVSNPAYYLPVGTGGVFEGGRRQERNAALAYGRIGNDPWPASIANGSRAFSSDIEVERIVEVVPLVPSMGFQNALREAGMFRVETLPAFTKGERGKCVLQQHPASAFANQGERYRY